MNAGLEGVVAVRTVLSMVDGQEGRLIVRGAPIEQLSGIVSFEEMASRLWQDLSPEVETPEGVAAALGRARGEVFARLQGVLPLAKDLPYFEGLVMALSSLARGGDPTHYHVAAALPVALAGLSRLKRGLAPVAPDPALGHAADVLRMLRGERAGCDDEQALDAYLVTVAEHGMNASTFTARVIASTRAGLLASVTGALGALKGPLHGGAPGPVLDMLDAIATPDRITPWLTEALASGERLMGFGHRIYRVRDPRADVLKQAVTRLRQLGNARLRFAEQVEREALALLARHKPDRPLQTNVEFYTALLLEAIGLERELFTPVFAVGRVLGWTAHVFEQERTGRIIRPESEYIGPNASALPV